jgi:acetylornithine deacetylase/succinyl-diaminopimelate desuccinylase-like protein
MTKSFDLDRFLDRSFIASTLTTLLKTPTDVPLGETTIEPDDPKLVHYVREVISPILEQLSYNDFSIDELNNLILRVGSCANAKRLLLMAYTPAQHANLMDDPLSGRITNAAAYGHNELCAFGQGASQNKGSLASVLGALKLLRDMDEVLDGQLIFVVNNEGRSSHACSAHIFESQDIHVDAGILCIGTDNRIALGNRGRVDVNIRVIGKSCHSSQPWRGLNAIDGAYNVLSKLRSLPYNRKHPYLGPSQLTVYQATFYPIAPHTIPEVASLIVDRRLLPGEEPDQAVNEIVEAIGDISPFGLEISKGAYMYPCEVPEDTHVVQVLKNGFVSVRDYPPETYYPLWTFDAGYACRMGIPTVQVGPSSVDSAGAELMGTDFVALSQVEEAAKVYAYTIIHFLENDEG